MKINSHISLKKHNTFGIDARAEYFCDIMSVAGLQELLKSDLYHTVSHRVLGGGSNVLLTKPELAGITIMINILGVNVVEKNKDHVLVECGAGVNWHDFVMQTLDNGWYGLENLALIPGKVGAAPVQNIGAYGRDLSDCFHSLQAVHRDTATVRTFTKSECRFGYRDSVFKNELKDEYVITYVTFELSRTPKVHTQYKTLRQLIEDEGIQNPTPKQVAELVMDIRQSKLPSPETVGSAGSFFKNPIVSGTKGETLLLDFPTMPVYPLPDGRIKLSAAWMIDHCGWRGHVQGNAGTYPHQALVLINKTGKATGAEIWDLAQKIQEDVEQRFGIALEPEVNIW